MHDKPFNDADKEDFSLNNFDLADDKPESSNAEMSEDFNSMIGGEDPFDQKDKLEPSIPEAFNPVEDSFTADEMNSFDDPNFPYPSVEEPAVSADHFDEGAEASEEGSDNNSSLMVYIAVAVLVAAVVAWFSMGSSDDADVSERPVSHAVLDNDVQMQRAERKSAMLEERVNSLQQQLLLKDEKIAELTHVISEQAIKQKRLMAQKAALAVKKQVAVVQKQIPAVQPVVVKRIQQAPAVKPVVKKSAVGWVIVIASLNSRGAADRAIANLKAKGIAAEVNPIMVKGNPWYRIRVSGFTSRQEANAQKAYMASQHGIKDTWIHKPK